MRTCLKTKHSGESTAGPGPGDGSQGRQLSSTGLAQAAMNRGFKRNYQDRHWVLESHPALTISLWAFNSQTSMRPLQCTHPLLRSQRATACHATLVAWALQTECFPWPHTLRPQQAGWETVGQLSAPRSNLAWAGWQPPTASAEASERLEVRPYTNTCCFSSGLMSAYPRHKLSPTYAEGRQPSFPRTAGALLTHSRGGLGGRRRDSIIGDPLENAEAKPAAPGNHSSTQSINSHHPLTYSTNPQQELPLCQDVSAHLVCSKHAMLQGGQC